MRTRWFAWSVPVVMLAFGFASLSLAQDKKADAKEKNIVDTAKANDNLKEFVKLLEAADLVKTLNEKGPYTVFAPTDEAFAKDKAAIDDLKKPENKAKLQHFLKNHVIAKKHMAADVQKMKDVKTLAGTTLAITFKDGKLMIEKANVTKADIAASNGVIHVIDGVLTPAVEKKDDGKKADKKDDKKKDEPKKDDKKK
jgi:uncharacterized surface protein with fasciclin (FAS1) repeats